MAEDVPDNGPLITGSIWFISSFCFFFLIARLYVRFTRGRGFWWDDWTLIVSWICLLGQTAMTQACIKYGFGRYIKDLPNPANIFIIVIYGQVGLTFAAFAITLSKISFALTLLRLTEGWWRYLVWFTIVTMGLLSLPAAVLPWIQCRPFAKGLDDSIPGSCFDKNISIQYGIFMSAWNASMDFVLAAIPWTVLWKLNMNTTEKLGVGVCMSLGVLAGIVAIIKTFYLRQLASKDFSYDGVEITCWYATESAAAIIAASIPVLRVFIREKASSKGYGSRRGIDEIHLSRVGGSNHDPNDPRKVLNEVWISAHKRSDDDSDRSILRGEVGSGSGSGGIVQTSTFMIDTHSDTEVESGSGSGRGSGGIAQTSTFMIDTNSDTESVGRRKSEVSKR